MTWYSDPGTVCNGPGSAAYAAVTMCPLSSTDVAPTATTQNRVCTIAPGSIHEGRAVKVGVRTPTAATSLEPAAATVAQETGPEDDARIRNAADQQCLGLRHRANRCQRVAAADAMSRHNPNGDVPRCRHQLHIERTPLDLQSLHMQDGPASIGPPPQSSAKCQLAILIPVLITV